MRRVNSAGVVDLGTKLRLRGLPQTPGNVNVLLGWLVDAGALYRIRKSECAYAYTAPKFRNYLRRRDTER